MSDESSENTPKTSAPAPSLAPPTVLNLLQKESDRAVRPGFRSPANAKSKASKANKKR